MSDPRDPHLDIDLFQLASAIVETPARPDTWRSAGWWFLRLNLVLPVTVALIALTAYLVEESRPAVGGLGMFVAVGLGALVVLLGSLLTASQYEKVTRRLRGVRVWVSNGSLALAGVCTALALVLVLYASFNAAGAATLAEVWVPLYEITILQSGLGVGLALIVLLLTPAYLSTTERLDLAQATRAYVCAFFAITGAIVATAEAFAAHVGGLAVSAPIAVASLTVIASWCTSQVRRLDATRLALLDVIDRAIANPGVDHLRHLQSAVSEGPLVERSILGTPPSAASEIRTVLQFLLSEAGSQLHPAALRERGRQLTAWHGLTEVERQRCVRWFLEQLRDRLVHSPAALRADRTTKP